MQTDFRFSSLLLVRFKDQDHELLLFNKVLYYIPINVISLDTVDLTECDPMLRITTLWFSESISPHSETDDVAPRLV